MNIFSLIGLHVACLLLVAAFVFHCFEKRRGVPYPKGARHRRLTWPERVLLSLFVGCLIVYGSTKTNSIPRMLSAPGVAATPSSSQGGGVAAAPSPSQVALKPNQLAARFALVRVETNTPWCSEKPEGAHESLRIRLRGAAEDRFDAVSSTDFPWQILFGGEVVDGLTISTTGVVLPKASNSPRVARERLADLVPHGTNVAATAGVLAPLRAALGVLPEGRWDVLGSSNLASRVWWTRTPSNSIVVTWQNVLLNRDSAFPVSFQTELFPNGSFVYRYDLSRLGLSVQSEEFSLTNALVGAFSNGHGETFDLSTLQPFNFSTFQLFWHALSPDDTPTGDRDGDGLSTAEEIFVHGTDPGLPDTDGDGIPDGAEIAAGTDPFTRDVSDADILARVAASATNETFRTATVAATNALVSWRLWDGFAAAWPAAATNLVWERTFTLNRTSGWQQWFLSSSPSNGASWTLSGCVLEWEDSSGAAGSFTESPLDDGVRIPLGATDVATVTLRLRATGEGEVRCPPPLHLVAFAPEIRIGGGTEIDGEDGSHYSVFTKGSASEIRLSVDRSRRPSRAPLVDEELDVAWLRELEMTTMGDFAYEGDSQGGVVSARRPGVHRFPDFGVKAVRQTPARRLPRSTEAGGHYLVVLSPRVGTTCEGHGCDHGSAAYDWIDNRYYVEEEWPLDSGCLRKMWWRDPSAGGWCDGGDPYVSSGVDDPRVTTGLDGNTGTVYVGGTPVWSGTAEHVHDVWGCGDGSHDEYKDNGCACECDCRDGNCDSQEGTKLDSLKFRIPLGAPAQGFLAGFAYFSTESPIRVSRDILQVLRHPSYEVTDSVASGVRLISCAAARGRELAVSDITHGIRIVVRDAASHSLEHTWEIVNVDGDDSVVRLRRISRLDNVMSDETFRCEDGVWTRFDNVSRTGERIEIDGLRGDPNGWTEVRTRLAADGTPLTVVSSTFGIVGECDNALVREVRREEDNGGSLRWSETDHWSDPQNHGRHGAVRWVCGNDRPWRYQDYDRHGHETLRVEQRNGSAFPDEFPVVSSNGLLNSSTFQPFNFSTFPDAFVTLSGYEPMAGDSEHEEDRSRPRRVVRYAVRNGVPVQIAETRFRYQRGHVDGYETVKEEKWRTGVSGESAYSYTVTFTDTGPGTPLLMRNAVAESLDEDGTLTENAYSLSNDVLVCTSRRSSLPSSQSNNPSIPQSNNPSIPQSNNPSIPQSNNSHPLPIYEITESDATYGNVLRRATCLTDGDAVIAEERSTYDEKNRLRSTTYLDGTSLTNAYSCCRLLWRSDTALRRVLRSATTGTDHLYNAEEEVWLGEMENEEWRMENGEGAGETNRGFRVTQHFFDAFGRETNTVVCVGHTPGEAVDPDFVLHGVAAAPSPSQGGGVAAAPSPSRVLSRSTTEYPSGGSDCSIHTDERGKVTVTWKYAYDDYDVTIIETRTNDLSVVYETREAYRNGATVTHRSWWSALPGVAAAPSPSQSTTETRSTDYAADGTRIDTVVTQSSDCGIVTNSVTRHDLLGRVVSVATPLGVTSNFYDGATSRILNSIYTAGIIHRDTLYCYNNLGEQIGTVQDGITNRTDVLYEFLSNVWWKVTREATVGPGTNALTTVREQLTGLEDGLRSRTVKSTLGGATVLTETRYDGQTGILTTTTRSSNASDTIEHSHCGIVLDSAKDGVVTFAAHDALGRTVYTERSPTNGTVRTPVARMAYNGLGDLVRLQTYTNGTDVVVESYAYDAFGNRVRVEDALGNVVETVYDVAGNVVAESGATYPIRQEFDTQGRRVALYTTRDGIVWDVTRWTYDAATGLCTSKTYADGSVVTYTYTPDGLPLRTTYASGRWIENVYDARRQLVGTLSSDGEGDSAVQRDAYGRETSAANGNASYTYALDRCGFATNGTATIGGIVRTFRRTVDAQGRLASFGMDGGYATQTINYRADGRIGSMSNADAVVTYSYSEDGHDLGYSLALAGGTIFTRTLTRDPYRRELVLNVANSTGGGFAYSYDALSRPVTRNADTFAYNNRSEVVSSRRGAENAEAYSYDEIGNLLASFNFSTNVYAANNLNQYSSILALCASAPPRETNPSYDADGNMTAYGQWSYTYDSANRLVSVSSNGVLLVTNFYDARGRRVKKVTQSVTLTFFYDGWNLVEECVTYTNGTTSTIHYYWGKDLSGTFQGAGGVGGLLYLTIDGTNYIPCYDNNGNITRYLDSNGSTVAAYTYDAFGRTIAQSGPLAGVFRHRFSTKYFDVETGLYYYGYRFYLPLLMCWLNRDPLDEHGGINLYSFCHNNAYVFFDKDGQAYFAKRALLGTPWVKGLSINSFLDKHNAELSHENLFFEDGKTPSNVGYFNRNDDNPGSDNLPGLLLNYVITASGFNDCVMRESVSRVKPKPYSLLGLGAFEKYNCQDYAQELREEYYRLLMDSKVMCKCGLLK